MRTRLFLAAVGLAVVPALAQDYTIAIVGLRHSHTWGHLERIAKDGAVRLVGIAEPIPELVAEARRRGVHAPVFDDYRQMLDKLKPTMVWAFVENNRHLEIVEACGPRRTHVIFEKPLAATWAQAVRIRALAEQHGIQVMTNYGTAWRPENETAHDYARSGRLGPIWRLRMTTGHRGVGMGRGINSHFFAWLTDPEKNGAGALMDFGCYNALAALWYLGRPERVYAQAHQLRPDEFPKVEDHATMLLTYRNAVAILEQSWDLPTNFSAFEVFGRDAGLRIEGGKVEVRQGRESREIEVKPLPPERADPITYLADCLRHKRPLAGLVAIDINVGVNEIVEAAKSSIGSGQPVTLPLP